MFTKDIYLLFQDSCYTTPLPSTNYIFTSHKIMEFIKQYTLKILAAMRTRLYSIESSLNSNYTSMTILLTDWKSQYHNRWCKIAPYLVFLPSTSTHALLQFVFQVWWIMGFSPTYYSKPQRISSYIPIASISFLKQPPCHSNTMTKDKVN